MHRLTRRAAAAAIWLGVAQAGLAYTQEKPLVAFAAASLKNAIDDVNAAYGRKAGGKVVMSYAATSTLMKQIEQGAPADLFFSADIDWMNYGSKRKLIRDATRLDLLGNRLVLIAPADTPAVNVTIGQGFDLAALAGAGRIAVADVRAVPAGKYAKAALESLGAWPRAEPKLAMTDNVRAALSLVARGEAPLGIVYETDAKVEPGVKIIGVFPAQSHAPIVYSVAATIAARPGADRYLDFLRGDEARTVFERYGFTLLTQRPPVQ